jgi:hypothetical protein
MHKSKSLFNCSGAGTGEPGAVKAASPGSGRDGQKRSGSRTSLAVYSTTFCTKHYELPGVSRKVTPMDRAALAWSVDQVKLPWLK